MRLTEKIGSLAFSVALILFMAGFVAVDRASAQQVPEVKIDLSRVKLTNPECRQSYTEIAEAEGRIARVVQVIRTRWLGKKAVFTDLHIETETVSNTFPMAFSFDYQARGDYSNLLDRKVILRFRVKARCQKGRLNAASFKLLSLKVKRQ